MHEPILCSVLMMHVCADSCKHAYCVCIYKCIHIHASVSIHGALEFMKIEMNIIDTCSHVTGVSILAEHLHACYACLYTYAC